MKILILSLFLQSCALIKMSDSMGVRKVIAKNPELKPYQEMAINRDIRKGFPEKLLYPIRARFWRSEIYPIYGKVDVYRFKRGMFHEMSYALVKDGYVVEVLD